MSRPIKFRAWNGKEWVTAKLSLLSQLPENIQEWQQFTGLKDKNGKEIYEGDIVNVHIFVQELGENFGVTEGEREFVAEVKFGVTGITVENKNFRDNPVFYDEFHEESLEVIGNVYENPELLK